MPEAYMKDPMVVFLQYLEATEGVSKEDRKWFEYGISAFALHVITWIKTLERLPITTEVGRQEAIVAMRTMLTELDLWDEAYEAYEQLAEWRRPKFLAEQP